MNRRQSGIYRELIYLIARHSNWHPESIEKKLLRHVYACKSSWAYFLRLFFIGLGMAFMTTGIIFFFAYNWASMHKFLKLGLLEALILLTTGVYLFSKWKAPVKNILLTVNAMLVGVLLAVFGQIYQTGANAYDFFLGWTGFIALWVIASRYTPLWLVFIALLNTTLILYAEQVAVSWQGAIIFDILFFINCLVVCSWELLSHKHLLAHPQTWFPRVIALAAFSFLTISMMEGLFDDFSSDRGVSFLLAAIFYTLGIMYGLRKRAVFYIAAIPFSIIIVVSACFIRLAGDNAAGVFFIVSLFTIGSTTLLVRQMVKLNRQWYGHP